MKKLAIIGCVAGALSLGCRAATYYVKPDGNDSAAGTSWETALKTVNKGFSKIHNNNEVIHKPRFRGVCGSSHLT